MAPGRRPHPAGARRISVRLDEATYQALLACAEEAKEEISVVARSFLRATLRGMGRLKTQPLQGVTG